MRIPGLVYAIPGSAYHRTRIPVCIVRGPPIVDVIRPAVPGPAAANVLAGFENVVWLNAL
jgi:hypothetical protein